MNNLQKYKSIHLVYNNTLRDYKNRFDVFCCLKNWYSKWSVKKYTIFYTNQN